MQGCGLTSLVASINDRICDLRERNVTIRCEIWTTNIRSLGFRDIRERVILWRLMLRSFGCICPKPNFPGTASNFQLHRQCRPSDPMGSLTIFHCVGLPSKFYTAEFLFLVFFGITISVRGRRFLGIIGEDPSVSKSNRLVHIVLFWSFYTNFEKYSINSSKKPGYFTL